jgi:hypothetical protein
MKPVRKFPGTPLTEQDLKKVSSATEDDMAEAIATADPKLKEYLEAKGAGKIRS